MFFGIFQSAGLKEGCRNKDTFVCANGTYFIVKSLNVLPFDWPFISFTLYKNDNLYTHSR